MFGRTACGCGWINDSSLEHITGLASPGAEVERNFGDFGLAFQLKQDLAEKRPRPCFNFAFGQNPQAEACAT
jgi:hypothetical protein